MGNNDYRIDSHVHLDRILEGDPARVDWMIERNLAPISWAFSEGRDSFQAVRSYLEEQKELVRRLNLRGLRCYHVVGIHPRCIPPEAGWDLPPEVFLTDLFLRFREDPYCLGVGEIGLETGSDLEIAVFKAHLKALNSYREGCVCVHTPREDKVRVMLKALDILEQADLDPNRIVVDHLTPETVGSALERGFWAGVTMSPIKCGPEDVLAILDRFPKARERVMLNTDSNHDFYEDLFRFVHSRSTRQDWAYRIGFENTARFFGILDRF
ncbi:MAG: TatD family hydrolase [Deltaproteobacteria bacterium]|nr:TatD family hydrolase [Deltaproteobacteria bacterium]